MFSIYTVCWRGPGCTLPARPNPHASRLRPAIYCRSLQDQPREPSPTHCYCSHLLQPRCDPIRTIARVTCHSRFSTTTALTLRRAHRRSATCQTSAKSCLERQSGAAFPSARHFGSHSCPASAEMTIAPRSSPPSLTLEVVGGFHTMHRSLVRTSS